VADEPEIPGPWRRHYSLLLTIRIEWDAAEADIKRAEQINQAICVPAIKELRYAGRRIIDAIAEINCGDPKGQAEIFINDARLGCYRARHDAIDAATAKIVSDIDIAFEKFGHDVVIHCYNEFPRLYELIEHAKSEIAKSRSDRTLRLTIYQNLADKYFEEIISRYNSFRVNTHNMLEVAKVRRRAEFRNNVFGYAGLVFGTVGILLAIIFYIYS